MTFVLSSGRLLSSTLSSGLYYQGFVLTNSPTENQATNNNNNFTVPREDTGGQKP